ncbi:MAG: DUF2806 domain-containing protein [Candidatus Peribacteria bacterium]|nr:DUF2806 domain-containing protein [Candidatus Peribacteria bacterium]
MAFWRRKNAAKIIEKSRKFSEKHNVSLNKIPSKFLVEFMNDASLEEDEDLQMLWAKILSGESENPNSFSLKTLEILKVMNKNDAEIFLNLTRFLIIESNEVVFLLNNEKLLEQYKIKYSDLMKLEEYGLIVLDISLVLSLDISTE